MIIVLGSVLIREGQVPQALQLSQQHVERSRQEPGCIEHGVSVDAHNPLRLVFVERWESMPALLAHFAVPESRAFVKAVAALATQPPSVTLYEAAELRVDGRRA